MVALSNRGICTGCGQSRAVTNRGLVYLHQGPDHRACPGGARLPKEAGVAPSMVAGVLDQLIQDLPIRQLGGHSAVLLVDLNAAIDRARVDAGLPPLGAGGG